jgi:hypothetical protein
VGALGKAIGEWISMGLAKARAYISRAEVKVFGVKIFLNEWTLTHNILCHNKI